MAQLPVRNSVRVLLFNEKQELLLICAEDPNTTTMAGKKYGRRFWFTVGGQIEKGETLEEAAYREIFEETGIVQSDVELGPIVWYGAFDLIVFGTPSHLKQRFIVAHTRQNVITHAHLTQEEQAVVKESGWFSLEQIRTCPEVIYPVLLPHYLPPILAKKYPKEPLELNLGKEP